jgi:hypothetical protein
MIYVTYCMFNFREALLSEVRTEIVFRREDHEKS